MIIVVTASAQRGYCRDSYMKGKLRDKSVILDLEELGVMDAKQIMLRHFRFPWGERKMQDRMLELFRNKKVHRWPGEFGRYIYSLEPKNSQSDHRLAVNWVRMYFESCRPSWEKLHSFQYEQDYGILRTDGFVAMKDFSKSPSGVFDFWFLELDRSHRNKFDKVTKYCRLFNEGIYQDRWWFDLTDKFPRILVVTTSETRKQKILDHIRDENTAGLRWEVRLLDELKEVMQR